MDILVLCFLYVLMQSCVNKLQILGLTFETFKLSRSIKDVLWNRFRGSGMLQKGFHIKSIAQSTSGPLHRSKRMHLL